MPEHEAYEKEEWFRLYRLAMVETHGTNLKVRIDDARTAIAARIERLLTTLGPHERERSALRDAVNGLRVLERERDLDKF